MEKREKERVKRYVRRHLHPFTPVIKVYEANFDVVWGTRSTDLYYPFISIYEIRNHTNNQEITYVSTASLKSSKNDLTIISIKIGETTVLVAVTPREKFIDTVRNSQLPKAVREAVIKSATRSRYEYLVVSNTWCELIRYSDLGNLTHWHPILKVCGIRDIAWKYLVNFSDNSIIKRLPRSKASLEELLRYAR
jgi:hypothetical protein